MDRYAGQILVVDDDPIYSQLLQVTLEEAHFRVTLASNLGEFRSLISQRAFDFVLLDLFLGDESGFEAIPDLIRKYPYVKIIMMSAHGTIELAVDSMVKGATSFFAKSKDPVDLVDSISRRMQTAPLLESNLPHSNRENYGIIGQSPKIQEVLTRVRQVSDIDSTVLIIGESGTGKELVARAIHRASKRKSERFEAINCGAIPENLIESELFGHVKGAFTDARADRKGLFQICDNGTLFLDEVGEMPFSLQVKLLRVLQEREVMPLGGSESIKLRTRVIAATNRDLSEEVKAGRFRSDLFYRMNVLQIRLPPLRERRQDIPLLIEYCHQRFNQRFGKNVKVPSMEVQARLLAYDWPGNIRELQNAVERGIVLSADNEMHIEDMMEPSLQPNQVTSSGDVGRTTLSEAKKDFEKRYLQDLLEVTGGNISEIARISGRYRADIYRLMSKYGVSRPDFTDNR
jgi:two-component system, NtrC family, response regulator GlrR